MLDRSGWSVWRYYGGQNVTGGDPLVGSHQRSADVFGLAIGLDYAVRLHREIRRRDLGRRHQFGLSDGLGTGNSDMVQAAIYARKDFDRRRRQPYRRARIRLA